VRIDERVVQLNDKPVNARGRYVLYWMQMYKRAEYNHALGWAIQKANELKLPNDSPRFRGRRAIVSHPTPRAIQLMAAYAPG